jgi:hypothetical protein
MIGVNIMPAENIRQYSALWISTPANRTFDLIYASTYAMMVVVCAWYSPAIAVQDQGCGSTKAMRRNRLPWPRSGSSWFDGSRGVQKRPRRLDLSGQMSLRTSRRCR